MQSSMFKQSISYEIWGGASGKYQLKDDHGNPIDLTPEDTCKRVARGLSDVETKNKEHWYQEFSKLLLEGKISGGGRIMANIGATHIKKEVSAINCVVSRQIADSLNGIMSVAKEAALVLKAGCGIGYDFSPLRPKGALVAGAGSGTSGVISFMKIFDAVCSTILSGGSRRGAQMGCLDIYHPDIEEFITAKRQDGVLRYFNLSVLVNSKFMNAVKNDEMWDLWFWEKVKGQTALDINNVFLIKKNDIPFNHPEESYFKFAPDHVEAIYSDVKEDDIFQKKIYKTIKAKDLFDLIMKSTYEFAEPGFLVIDRINYENNLWFTESIRATNPCVTGDTRLHTQYGMVKIEDLYNSKQDLQVTVDNRALDKGLGSSVVPAVPAFMSHPSATVYKVTTKAGYEIKATEWHKFHTQRGILELKDLKVGDTLYTLSGHGQFGNQGSRELGLVMGMIAGDGHIGKKDSEDNRAALSFWGKDTVLAEDFLSYVKTLIKDVENYGNGHEYRVYPLSVKNVKGIDKCQIASRLLSRYLETYGFTAETKLKVPEVIWQGTEECIKGYLQGLFQSDGTVNVSGHNRSTCSIRLNSSTPELLKEVQVLLSNFGIYSAVYLRRKERDKMMPDGKGGKKLYHCKANYELIIDSSSRNTFIEKIGFLLDYKQSKATNFINKMTHGQTSKHESKIISIEHFADNVPVYDTTTIHDCHSLVFNGLSTGNCGEQNLSPLSSCLLGSMILPGYIENQFENNVSFDFDKYKQDIHIASRFLDNVIEISNLPLQELDETLKNQRRHGLGFTGLGSAINMMKMKYGSKESIEFSEKITLILAQEGLLIGIKLAQEKGCAPVLSTQESRESFIQSGYMKRLLETFESKEKVIADIMKYGIRWSHSTSIAPTGTMSLTWGNNCSSGLEPVFANSYMRNIRVPGKKTKTQEEVCDYSYFEWKNKYGDKPLPEWWSVTENLSVEDHLNIQEVVQRWVDAAVSKTINVPTEYSFEEFKEVYFKGWSKGLKGVTTFRFNPEVFSGVLMQKEDLEKTTYTFTLEDGTSVSVKGSDNIEYDGETHNAANLFDAFKEGLYGNM